MTDVPDSAEPSDAKVVEGHHMDSTARHWHQPAPASALARVTPIAGYTGDPSGMSCHGPHEVLRSIPIT